MMRRKRVSEILGLAKSEDKLSRAFDIFLITLILLNVGAVVLQSVGEVYAAAPWAFDAFEIFSVVIFSLEYLGRVWTAVENPRFAKPVLGRIRYAFTPMAIIDLLAILPFYLQIMGGDMRFLRAFRAFRVLRIIKLQRYWNVIKLFYRIYLKTRDELLVTGAILLLLLIIAASRMYYAERNVQPEIFSSIPAAMWWAVATLTTVGYGDVYPVTDMGRLFGAIVAIMGIGVFALPTGIIGSALVEEVKVHRKKTSGREKCPMCGQPVEQQKLDK